MNQEDVKKINIPKTPGSYQFKNKQGEIIYIGKAINLKSRINSYWSTSTNHTPAKYSMLKNVAEIEWIETDNEIEALLLEANLIKKYQPQYNVMMRDDKRHTYIKISVEEKWPKIFLTRKIEKSGKYFGPFTSVEAIKETLKVIRKIWPYRTCSFLPKKTCLYYRIYKCPGCCEEKIEIKEYKKIIQQIILFLEGKKDKVLKNIEQEIKKLEKKPLENSESMIKIFKWQKINIEKVLSSANVLSLLDKYATDVVELAKVLNLPCVPNRIEGYDISNIYGRQAVGSMVVFNDGEENKSEYKKFKIKFSENEDGAGGDVGMLKEVLERRLKRIVDNDKSWPNPDLIILDGGKQQLNVVVRLLKKYKLEIAILAVSKGDGLRGANAPDKIFFPGQARALELPLASPALHIIKRVRDEAHRFAVSYHKKLRKKKFFGDI